MKTIMSIFLAVPAPTPQNSMPMEMNSNTWFAIGLVVAILLLIYLVIAMVKPEKF
ncbi:MAG: K(+)-transporting ATPase subunit F [Bacteroidales bacterium]|jgi:K+-transporting ATPase KdpF subunit